MSDESDFQELIRRVRALDDDACEELLRCFGPTLERMARVRLRHYGVQGPVNPSDVIQSVLALFFVRAAEGKYELNEPADYEKLMYTMVDRKAKDHRRREKAGKRGGGSPVGEWSVEPVDGRPTPSEVAAGKELYEKVWSSLSAQERELVDHVHRDALSWHEIGERLGKSHEAVRKDFNRLCARLRERWLKEVDHG